MLLSALLLVQWKLLHALHLYALPHLCEGGFALLAACRCHFCEQFCRCRQMEPCCHLVRSVRRSWHMDVACGRQGCGYGGESLARRFAIRRIGYVCAWKLLRQSRKRLWRRLRRLARQQGFCRHGSLALATGRTGDFSEMT